MNALLALPDLHRPERLFHYTNPATCAWQFGAFCWGAPDNGSRHAADGAWLPGQPRDLAATLIRQLAGRYRIVA
ncbi:hypothetical protein ACPA9J_31560 [Pseudomonas aeruginosa]